MKSQLICVKIHGVTLIIIEIRKHHHMAFCCHFLLFLYNSSWVFLSKMLGDVFCRRKLSRYIWCKDKMPIPCISIVHLVTSFSHLFKLKTQYYPIWPVVTCTAPHLRGHSTTTWTKFWPFLTPSPPRVDKHGHFTYTPPCPRGLKVDKSLPPP